MCNSDTYLSVVFCLLIMPSEALEITAEYSECYKYEGSVDLNKFILS